MAGSPIGNVTTGTICFLAGLLAAIAMVLGRATAGRWLAAFSAVSALAIMWAPIEKLAEGQGFTRPPGGILAFFAVIGVLAAVGEPRAPRGSRGLFALLAASPSVAAVFVTALSLQPEPWFFYRHYDQNSLRFSLGILLGTTLLVIAVVLLLAGHRAWGAALAINSVPWLPLFYLDPLLGGVSSLPVGSLPMGGFSLLLAVAVSALLAGLIVVRISRRRQAEAGNSVASSE